jgi:hypothetical protein
VVGSGDQQHKIRARPAQVQKIQVATPLYSTTDRSEEKWCRLSSSKDVTKCGEYFHLFPQGIPSAFVPRRNWVTDRTRSFTGTHEIIVCVW